ncbi:MAG: hypothetical protein NTY66_03460 [Candidatus Vogelbacteria bacterium]|nr:hypothetical protein [Candidatus Vogelbacteria bacterium]
MSKLANLLPPSGSLHHAYLIAGNQEVVRAELAEALTGRFGPDFVPTANPDYLEFTQASWGIEDSRALKAWMSRKPIGGGVKCAVLLISSVTSEAQNALLKTLEEPVPNTHFFIITSRTAIFLPTIVSRCQVIEFGGSTDQLAMEAKRFLEADLPERYIVVKELLDRQADGEKLGPDFLNALLENYWRSQSGHSSEIGLRGAEAIVRALELSGQRGGSLRLLLEHLAAVVPIG